MNTYRNIIDSSGNFLTTSDNDLLYSSGNFKPEYTDSFETWLASSGAYPDDCYMQIQPLEGLLTMMGKFSLMARIWPIYRVRNTASMLVEYKGGTSLIVSGDVSYGIGIAGDGAASYFDTDYNFSTRISDINNFAMGIVSWSDTNAGVDFGATDGTNEISISIRDSDQATFKVGTSSYSSANTSSIGHFILQSYAGSFYGYKGTIAGITELANGGPDTVGGSLPNYNAFIGARNDTGSADSFSARQYTTVWIYNGAVTEEGIAQINRAVMQYNLFKGVRL